MAEVGSLTIRILKSKNRNFTRKYFLMNKHFFRVAILVCVTLSSCMNIRIKEHEEWKTVFDEYGVEGCFEMYDNNKEIAHYYNKERCATRFTPASTFKILNSLIGLETGVADNDQFVIKWDGIQRWNENWNQDLTMAQAFKYSAVPYYQQLARLIGAEKMHYYIDTIKYGSMMAGGAIDSFWLNDTLQVSADEQVGFLKRLYFAELPGFSERSQRIVQHLMLQEEKPQYRLFYKTGWGKVPGKPDVIWIVGAVESIHQLKNVETQKIDNIPHPYFFAMNFSITDTTKDWGKIRMDMLNKLLATQSLSFQ